MEEVEEEGKMSGQSRGVALLESWWLCLVVAELWSTVLRPLFGKLGRAMRPSMSVTAAVWASQASSRGRMKYSGGVDISSGRSPMLYCWGFI